MSAALDAQIVAYDMQGNHQVVMQGELTPIAVAPDAPGEFCNDLAVNSKGDIWFTDRENQAIVHVDAAGNAQPVAGGFRSNGISLSSDEKILAVTDSYAPRLWAFAILENGELKELPEYFEPILLSNKKPASKRQVKPGTNGMTVDEQGRFYVTTFTGIQVYSPDGKTLGLLKKPTGYMSSLAFGGAQHEYLYVTGLQGIFRIHTLTRGVAAE